MEKTNGAVEVKGTLQFNDGRENVSLQGARFGDSHIQPPKVPFFKRLLLRKNAATIPIVSARETPELHTEAKTAEKIPEKSRELPSLDALQAAAEAYRKAHPWQNEPTRERVIWDKDRE